MKNGKLVITSAGPCTTRVKAELEIESNVPGLPRLTTRRYRNRKAAIIASLEAALAANARIAIWMGQPHNFGHRLTPDEASERYLAEHQELCWLVKEAK